MGPLPLVQRALLAAPPPGCVDVRRGRAPSLATLLCFVALLGALWSDDAHADDSLSCTLASDEVLCDVDSRAFLAGDIKNVLNNGWENSLHYSLVLLDTDDNIVGVTYTELDERCYIDPFDDPCLALWAGSETWQTYEDVKALIEAVGRFRLRSLTRAELQPGTYTARMSIELNPITTEQASVIRSWIARNRGGHLVVGKSESSIFGTFVSVFANIRPGHAEATYELLSAPFEIPPAD